MLAATLIDQLARSLLAEEEARRSVRDALREQATLLRELRGEGLALGRIAHRLGRALGHALSVRERLRLAERLRKRAARARTDRPPDLAVTHGQPPIVDARSDRALMPEKESTMPKKLIRRTVVEEFTQDIDDFEDQDHEQDDEDEDGDDESEENEATPVRRRARGK